MEVVYPISLLRCRTFLPAAYLSFKRRRDEEEEADPDNENPMERMVKKAREMVLNDEVPGELPLNEEMSSDEVLRNTAINSLSSKVPLGVQLDEDLIKRQMGKLRQNEFSSILSVRISKAMDALIEKAMAL